MMYCIKLSELNHFHCTALPDLELSCLPSKLVPPHTTTGTDEEGVPSDSYLQEVQEQLEKRWEGLEGNQDERTARREGNQDERTARSLPDNSDGE